jgi:hypothetical protein
LELDLTAPKKMIVLTNPVDGREAEYNDWYDNQHLADVLAVEGISAARRYDLVPGPPGAGPPSHRYLAIYDVEGDPEKVMEELARRGQDGSMPISESLDMNSIQMSIWTHHEQARQREV